MKMLLVVERDRGQHREVKTWKNEEETTLERWRMKLESGEDFPKI